MQIRGDSIKLVRGVFGVRAAQVADHAGRSRAWMTKTEQSGDLSPQVARQAVSGLFAAVLDELDRNARGDPPKHDEARPGCGNKG